MAAFQTRIIEEFKFEKYIKKTSEPLLTNKSYNVCIKFPLIIKFMLDEIKGTKFNLMCNNKLKK